MIAAPVLADCRVCSQVFARRNSMQRVCSPTCALKLVKADKKAQAADRKQTRAQLEAIKPRSKWLSEAQAAFNAFIRARDALLPCISCDKGPSAPGSWDAGHYRTVGSCPELRFDEGNVNRQCVKCNQHLHGNAIAYRLGLLKRYGRPFVDRLEGPHEPAKLSVDDLRQIRDTYRAKARALNKQLETA